ncbi:heterokaryon incompatibility protein-domain-containing protein [Amylocarpus encephaloides]|uniref:Heterokaryon incompatibility protein-domain-containing protein n=1 Tax=Amylocarpus encephaloides TaxID=45428 RepID=A0A9P7YS26_9HELO|nr:heterokaryon incompatibility protein-domain-containing protein [Amylocarpus encephaloides]
MSRPEGKLCQKCEALDIISFIRGEGVNNDTSELRRKIKLDTIRNIIDRSQACDFCGLITSNLKQPGYQTQDIVIVERMFWFNYDLGHGLQKQFRTQVYREADESTTEIEGPLLHLAEGKRAAEQAVRNIMELQEIDELPINQGAIARPLGRIICREGFNFDRIKDWLRQCEASHGEHCGSNTRVPASLLKSFMVIDVHLACVIEAPDNCRYASLSYCWGTTKTLQHRKANSRFLLSPGSLNETRPPQTIYDAMNFVRNMGERYLWVDALCIVQDDRSVVQEQISQMGEIYSQALFSLVAVAGEAADSGLSGATLREDACQQKVLKMTNGTVASMMEMGSNFNLRSSTWGSRAWTMQEEVLSGRRIIFTHRQVEWRCGSGLWMEDMALEGLLPDTDNPRRMGDKWTSHEDYWKLRDMDPYSRYQTFVHAYIRRKLSFLSDSLNAITGILQTVCSDIPAFAWGLPESKLSLALNWGVTANAIQNEAAVTVVSDGKTHTIPIPSWTWASYAGGQFDIYVLDLVGPEADTTLPLVALYKEGAQGELLLVEEGPLAPPDAWTGTPRYIDDATTASKPNGYVDSGRLVFWTSTAPCEICRFRIPGRPGHFDNPYLYRAAGRSRNGMTWVEEASMACIDSKVTWERRRGEDCYEDYQLSEANISVFDIDYSKVDFEVSPALQVVVCGVDWKLYTLVVYWREGVAYRAACSSVMKPAWLERVGRKWEKVRLG